MTGGDYKVVITNSFGSITSAVATLAVLQPPVVTRQPKNVVAAPGAAVSFTVSAKGLTPLAYQWQNNGRWSSLKTLCQKADGIQFCFEALLEQAVQGGELGSDGGTGPAPFRLVELIC